jgi:hypothetical protein
MLALAVARLAETGLAARTEVVHGTVADLPDGLVRQVGDRAVHHLRPRRQAGLRQPGDGERQHRLCPGTRPSGRSCGTSPGACAPAHR